MPRREVVDNDCDVKSPQMPTRKKAARTNVSAYQQKIGRESDNTSSDDKKSDLLVLATTQEDTIENRHGAVNNNGNDGNRTQLTLAPAQEAITPGNTTNQVAGNNDSNDLENGTSQQGTEQALPPPVPPPANTEEFPVEVINEENEEGFDALVDDIVNKETQNMYNEIHQQLGGNLVVDAVAVDEKEKGNSDSSPTSTRGRIVACIVACFVILGSIGVAIFFILGRSSEDVDADTLDESLGSTTRTPAPITGTLLPTQAPTTAIPTNAPSSSMAPTQNQRKQIASDILFPISGSVIYEEGTSQYEAFEWLVYQDPAMLQFEQTPQQTIRERYILAVLYFSMNGKGWIERSKFLSDNPVCNWNTDIRFGVQCDSESNTVSELLLYENNLVGTIPPELNQLASLQRISLGSNTIGGPIPSGFGRLFLLEVLSLENNVLTGTIPPSLFELPRISAVILSENGFMGNIPETITSAVTLELVICYLCNLSGTLPSDWSNLTDLDSLYFLYNTLDGPIPESLINLPKLESLGLGGNLLTGPISVLSNEPMQDNIGPISLGSMFLSDNLLDSRIPEGLPVLPNLIQLHLSENFFTGQIPEFGDQPSIVSIYLDYNELEGSVPDSIGRLPNLQYLVVSGNSLSGTIPLLTANNNAISDISFSGCGLSGNFEEFLLSVPTSLESLNCIGNKLTGSIPTEIGLYTNLYITAVFSNSLTGMIPTEIGNLVEMELLGVGGNQISGDIPSEFGYLTKIFLLSFEGAQLRGEIPSEIGNLVGLESLGFGGNQRLRGTIPKSFRFLTELTWLTLYDTGITGNLNDIFCPDGETTWVTRLEADCAGSQPEVICDCCSACY